MDIMITLGAILTVIGLIGVIWSAVLARRAKAEAETDEALRDRLQKILPLNLGAFLLSALGLMAVVIGVILS